MGSKAEDLRERYQAEHADPLEDLIEDAEAKAGIAPTEPAEEPVHEPTDPRPMDPPRPAADAGAPLGPFGGFGSVMSASTDVAIARHPKWRVRVPNFVGKHMSETFVLASRAGLRIEAVELSERPQPVDGRVVSQDPPAGTKAWRGRLVRLGVTHERE